MAFIQVTGTQAKAWQLLLTNGLASPAKLQAVIDAAGTKDLALADLERAQADLAAERLKAGQSATVIANLRADVERLIALVEELSKPPTPPTPQPPAPPQPLPPDPQPAPAPAPPDPPATPSEPAPPAEPIPVPTPPQPPETPDPLPQPPPTEPQIPLPAPLPAPQPLPETPLPTPSPTPAPEPAPEPAPTPPAPQPLPIPQPPTPPSIPEPQPQPAPPPSPTPEQPRPPSPPEIEPSPQPSTPTVNDLLLTAGWHFVDVELPGAFPPSSALDTLEYRRAGGQWHRALPMWCPAGDAHYGCLLGSKPVRLAVGPEVWANTLPIGPDTEYEVRVVTADGVVHAGSVRTKAETLPSHAQLVGAG